VQKGYRKKWQISGLKAAGTGLASCGQKPHIGLKNYFCTIYSVFLEIATRY